MIDTVSFKPASSSAITTPLSCANRILLAVPTKMPSNLLEAKTAWENLALCMSKLCFNENGTINDGNIQEIIDFWKSVKLELVTPVELKNLPSLRLIRDQTLAVLGKLSSCKIGEDITLGKILLSVLSTPTVTDNSQHVLKFMSGDSMKPLPPHIAILASLLTPHRQMTLPTCSINALINAETFNHPERLAQTYLNLLRTNNDAPFSYGIKETNQIIAQEIHPHSLSTSAPYIVVTPTTKDIPQESPSSPLSSSNLSSVFGIGNEQYPTEKLQNDWLREGITHVGSTATADVHSLQIPIRNLTDLFFANFMQNIYSETDQRQVFIQARLQYFGIAGDELDFTNAIQAETADGEVQFTAENITTLQKYASMEMDAGEIRLLATVFSQPLPGDLVDPPLDPFNGHLENIDVGAFSSVDLGRMTINETVIIGDRNWVDEHGEACFLGLCKITADGYQFVTVNANQREGGGPPFQGWMAFAKPFE